MLELVFAINQTWTEIPDLADALLVFLISSLQQQERYISLTQDAKRLYPRAGSFKLGLDPVMGKKLHRITFQEAKAMLRDHCGLDARDEDDLSYVLLFCTPPLRYLFNPQLSSSVISNYQCFSASWKRIRIIT